jgi:hypothetical protein
MLKLEIAELPSENIIKVETEHLLLSFCTFCTLLKGKKLSFQNVFLLILQDAKLRDIIKEILSIDTTYEVVKLFVEYDPLITTSKYVTKFLNENPKLNL